MVPPSGPTPPNPEVIQRFLSSVLSQRGPSAVPYSEDTKWLIRSQLVALTSAYHSLEPKTANFTHNDGRSVNLLQADGTIPMLFQGVTYNIPVIIWLMESYPRHPPCVYVNPTRDMVIKRPHAYVNPSGLVSTPYLQNWVYPSSNLVELVKNLSAVFAQDPPLFAQRRPTSNPNPNPNLGHAHSSSAISNSGYSSYSGGYSGSSGSVNPIRPAIPPRAYPPSPYSTTSGSFSRVQTDDPNEVFKRNAINKLVEMVHGDMAGLRKTREAEMEGLFSAQAALRQRSDQLNKGLKEMVDEKEGLEQQLQVVLMNSDVLEGWLRENEGKSRGRVDADDAFEFVDVLSKQMLDSTASDLAIEDVVYSLDKALQEGAIPFDEYIKNVRSLSRKQFYHRATAAKVRAVQMQSQVANMASRLSHYASS